MISDRQLAREERKVARLFAGLRSPQPTHSSPPPHVASGNRLDAPAKTPRQRIEQILQRAEQEQVQRSRSTYC